MFIAVLLSESVRVAASAVQDQMRSEIGDDGANWVRAQDLHITVRFLGSLNSLLAASAAQCLQSTCRASSPFDLELAGVHAFPTDERPGTLYVAGGSGSDQFSRLASDLEERLVKHRLRRDPRQSIAHLTLARIDSYTGEGLAALAVAKRLRLPVSTQPVERIALIRSVLQPDGPQYVVLDEFALTGGIGE